MFRPVPAEADFTALEDEELARWAAHRVFERSVELRAGAEPWVFYEGPPTANGRPGLHHVWARVYKDLFCRYRTMRGYARAPQGRVGHPRPARRGGGREAARHHRQAPDRGRGRDRRVHPPVQGVGAELRGGVEDPHRAHRLLDRHRRRLLDLRPGVRRVGLGQPEEPVGPGPALRGHQGRALLPPVRHGAEQPRAGPARRLPGGGGRVGLRALPADRRGRSRRCPGRHPRPDLAGRPVTGGVDHHPVDPAVQHRRGGGTRPRLRRGGRRRGGRGAGGGTSSARARPSTSSCPARHLVGLHYRRPFDDVATGPADGGRVGWRVVAGDFVEADEGTGIVHLAPAFGEVDRQVGRDSRPAHPQPGGPRRPVHRGRAVAGRAVRPRHQREPSTTAWRRPGSWSAATPTSTPTRTAGGAAPRSSTGASRAGTSGPRSARPTWWPRTRPSAGIPSTSGTAGWGSGWPTTSTGPCPATATGGPPCRCGGATRATCAASARGPSCPSWRGTDVSDVDPHRPAIDEVVFPCPDCGGGTRAGAHAAGGAGHRRLVRLGIDADRPVGVPGHARARPSRSCTRPTSSARPSTRRAAGSTRCWPSTPWSAGSTPYRNVLCLGPHRRRRRPQDVQDGGQRHRPVGDPVDPGGRPAAVVDVLPGVAVDADPGQLRGHRRLDARRPADPVEHLVVLHHLRHPQRLRPGRPGDPRRRPTGRCSTAGCCRACTPPWPGSTESLDGYEPFPAATAIAELIDDTSNWYVRRSRRRFWRTDPGADPADSLGAQATLHEVLVTLARILAPMTPFLADRMWRDLTGADESDSVHLADWPEAAADLVDPGLEEGMALARRLSSLGRAARAEAGVKVRQPLARALVYLPPGQPGAAPGHRGGRAQRGPGRGDRRAGRRPRLRAGAQLQAARAPASASGSRPCGRPWPRSTPRPRPPSWRPAGRWWCQLDDGPLELAPEEVELRVRAQPGFAVSRDGGRGAGPRPGPRRRPGAPGAGPRGHPQRPGPPQGDRPRGVRLDPPVPGGARRPRAVLREDRPRGAGPHRCRPAPRPAAARGPSSSSMSATSVRTATIWVVKA